MKLGILVKQLWSYTLHPIFKSRLSGLSSDYCVVLTYHRVLPAAQVTTGVEPGMYVTPATLREHIGFLKRYFNIISVKQAEKVLNGEKRRENNRPFCVLTFDDGWLDFYRYAWPILQDEDTPATVYLPTGLIGTAKQFWTDRLATILKKGNLSLISSFFNEKIQHILSDSSLGYEHKLSNCIAQLKNLSFLKINQLLDQCEQATGLVSDNKTRTFMNWDEVYELSCSGLISFGSHTVHHAILTTLLVNDVQDELQMSLNALLHEKIADKDKISFCYPNGNYDQGIIRWVEKLGYSSAMSCDFGWNRVGDSLFSLKRISLHQDISSSQQLLAARLVQGLRQ